MSHGGHEQLLGGWRSKAGLIQVARWVGVAHLTSHLHQSEFQEQEEGS